MERLSTGQQATLYSFARAPSRAAHDQRISDAIEMDNAQVAVAEYRPHWWPADTRLLIRRVRLDPEQVCRPAVPAAPDLPPRTSESPGWPPPGRSTPTRSS